MPPRSRVDDPARASRGSPPRAVKVALALFVIAIGCLVALWGRILWYDGAAVVSPYKLGGVILGALIWSFLCFHIGRGKNWARVLLAILAIYDTGSMLVQFKYVYVMAVLGTTDLALYVVRPVAAIAGLILLFWPARAWFRP
jgi:hypothetical protein